MQKSVNWSNQTKKSILLASLDSAIFYINSKKSICCRTMSVLFYYFTIMQFAESYANGHLIHSRHDLLLTLNKNYCIMLSVIF